jgi:single-strand DNA-binding protein
VTRDPETKALPSGATVSKFGLATNHVFVTKAGEKKETAQFHNCVAFGKTAETIGKYVTKGQELYVQGRIEYREWDKKEGGKGYATEILVDSFQFGAKPKGAAGPDGTFAKPSYAAKEPDAPANPDDEIKIEDIQF